jgi:hypothetical protein
MEDGEWRADMVEFSDALIALRAALAEPECKCTMRQKMVGDGCAVCNPEMAKDLAEPDSDYERGFVDGMNLQTKRSVDKAVNRMAEPEDEPFMVVAPECAERGCMAHDDRVDGSGIVVQLRKEQEEVRRLHAELERKSDAIQRLWKERDELRAVLTKIVGSK